MADLGIIGKRVRKKPKYLRDDEEDEEETKSKQTKQKKPKKEKDKEKRKSKPKREVAKSKACEPTKPGIKLKIKIGGKSPSSSHASTPKDLDDSIKGSIADTEDGSDEVDIEGEASTAHSLTQDTASLSYADLDDESDVEDFTDFDVEMSQSDNVIDNRKSASKGNTAQDEDTSDEEREWLQAVESGDIEEYEKKKSEKNPALLTARQRRLIHGSEDNLMELPNSLAGKPLTEEQINSRKQKAIQRRQLALEKSEKAKKQTVDRLLKKSDAAISRGKAAGKSTGRLLPHVRYLVTKEKTTLSIPPGIQFPLLPQKLSAPPKPIRCAVTGCRNVKKYNCSKTKVSLCSLQCYKKNMLKHSHSR